LGWHGASARAREGDGRVAGAVTGQEQAILRLDRIANEGRTSGMGAKSPGILPSWVRTVHAMAAEPACKVRAICWTCDGHKDIDLQALAAKVDENYSLLDRRSPCRFTDGCKGWVRFMYLFGVYRHLESYERREIWAARDAGRAQL
jgi:hypothetical protein